ncbi:M56 family metallopeptidase [Paenibacillus puerhi]|uniref:M56 family metallopeptidase n=1 Tax=Paenibacillus puerhi TaxID=2692622 RepID=UPI0013585A66|nr:M56 family metallopeptidase [Paenibacillus puerhi]
MHMVSGIFLWFCYATLAASAVGLLVMAIQALFHRHMSPRMRHALWLIVLIRLLLPDFPSSPVSLFNALPLASGTEKAAAETQHLEVSEPPARISQQHPEKQLPVQKENNLPLQNHAPFPIALPLQETETAAPSSANKYPLALQIISAIWLAGAVAILLYLLFYMWKLRSNRKAFQMVTDPRILSVMNDCRKKFGIKQPIPLYSGHEMKSPYISGIVAPWIYIPEALRNQLNDAQLYHLFSHELAHYKRKDIAWNTIGSFVLAIHWMNPFIWICIAKMKADRELACDAYALEVLGEAEAIPYGMTIVEFLKLYSAKRHQPDLLYFNGSNNRNLAIRRITMIKSFKKGTYKFSTIAVLCVAVMSVMSLTNAAEPATPKKYVEGAPSPNLTDNRDNAVRAAGAMGWKIPETMSTEPRREEVKAHEERNLTEARPYAEGAAEAAKEGNAVPSPNLADNSEQRMRAVELHAESAAEAAKEEQAAPPPAPAANRLEKAVQDAGFTFKVPDATPAGYRMEQVNVNTKEVHGSNRTEAAIRFVQRKGESVAGNLEFFAIVGGDDLKTVYKHIEQSADKSGEWSVNATLLQMKDQYAMKVTEAVSGQSEKRYYIWEDQGVQYQIQVTGSVTDQEIITIVSSMKQPNADMYKRYADDQHSA